MNKPGPGHNSKTTVKALIDELNTTEVWREIDGYSGYFVSSWGRVCGRRNEILKPADVHGYEVISLSMGAEKKNVRVHRLVAVAFLGEAPFEDAIIAHNDGNKNNNRVGNLRWASARENQMDRARHHTHLTGSAVFGAKLTENDIPTIRARAAAGQRYRDIADDYGVSVSTISLIKRGRIWRSHGGAAWRR